jgi:iron complex outermembrane recepter protein
MWVLDWSKGVNFSQLGWVLLLAGVFPCLITQPLLAEPLDELAAKRDDTRTNFSQRMATIPQSGQVQRPAMTVKEWIAQIEAAESQAIVQVIGVKLDRTETGLNITLETTNNELLQIDTTEFTTEGYALVADIPDAVLALPTGDTFQADNPTEDIANVTITQVDATTIQITVAGKTALPTSEVTLKTGELVYSFNADEDEEELVVTGDLTRGYRVPSASTATGTDTPILETPFSVQVVPQDVIRDQQIIRIEDALTNISGVTFAGTNGGREASFNLRGFGGQTTNSVPVLRDGYRLYGSFQAIPEIANLQQIEVLKGPASILYGQIEPGGIINLVSKKPLADPFYEAALQVGSRELVRPRFDITGPLTTDRRLLYRLNGLYQHDRSFRDFDNDRDRFSIAPALTWKMSDRTDLALNLEYVHQESFADFGITRFGDQVAPIPRERVINNPDDTITTDYLSTGYSLEHRFSNNWKLRNGFRYIRYDYDYSVVALPFIVDDETVTRFYADQDGTDQSYSLYTNAVGNFNTGSIRHTLLAGVDLNRSESRIVTFFDAANPSPINIFDPDYDLIPKPDRSALPPFGDENVTAERLGIYVQDQIYMLDNLILVIGGRYDTVTQKTTNIETAFTDEGETNQSDDAFTPRIGLLYRPLPELAFFANYSQSFNPNSAATASGGILEPERGEGFEVGVKTELSNQRILATLTYFNITKQNVAVTDPDFPLFSIAVGEQKSQGIELDIAGEILPGWKVIGSYTYTDAEVSEDTNSDLIGNRVFGVPKHRISLWTTYEIQTGSLKGLGFGAGINYASDRFGDLDNSYQIGDYLIGNAAIFYRWDRYRIAINASNITNADYIRAVTGNEGGIEPGEPLTILGSFSMEF